MAAQNSGQHGKQQPAVIIIQPDPVVIRSKRKLLLESQSKVVKGLSITQVVVCGLAFLIQSITYVVAIHSDMRLYARGFLYTTGFGFWAGLLYGLSAYFGLSAAKNNTKGLIVCLMVFSIFAIFFGLIHFSFAIVDALSMGSFGAMAGFQIPISLVGIVTAAWLFGYACQAVCCRKSKDLSAQSYVANVVPGNSSLDLASIQQLNGLRIPLGNKGDSFQLNVDNLTPESSMAQELPGGRMALHPVTAPVYPDEGDTLPPKYGANY